MKKIFNGYSYYSRKDGGYYYRTQVINGKKKHFALHRDIWEFYSGKKIQPWQCIHHKDENKENNSYSNLEIVDKYIHGSFHTKKLWENKEYRDKQVENLNKVRHLAAEWQSSDEGRRIHKEISTRAWDNKKISVVKCIICNANVATYFPTRTKYCSQSCWQKDKSNGYSTYFTDERICLNCNKSFLANRHRKTKYCSRACSNKHRSMSH